MVSSLVIVSIVMMLLGYWIPAIVLFVIAVLVNWCTESFALGFGWNQENNKGQATLRVLTYNLNRAYSTSVNNGTDEEVLKLINEQEADLVLLQEFNPTLYRKIDEGIKANYPYSTLDEEGNRFKSVYSRYPIRDYQQLKRDEETLPICVMRIDVNGRTCSIATCHLMSNNFSPVYREIKDKRINLGKGIKETFSSIRQGCQIRQKQVEKLLEHLKGTDVPTLVCGDINDVAYSTTMRRFTKAGYKDSWWKRGFGFGFTYWGMKMRFRLDHILYSGSIKPVCVRVIQSKVSDHRPLVATFNFG